MLYTKAHLIYCLGQHQPLLQRFIAKSMHHVAQPRFCLDGQTGFTINFSPFFMFKNSADERFIILISESWMLSWKTQRVLILTCNQSECELLFYLIPGAAAGDDLLFKHSCRWAATIWLLAGGPSAFAICWFETHTRTHTHTRARECCQWTVTVLSSMVGWQLIQNESNWWSHG